MKKLIVLFAALTLTGCAGLSLPTTAPATPTIDPAPILKLICASPAAAADPKIASACAIYTALGGK